MATVQRPQQQTARRVVAVAADTVAMAIRRIRHLIPLRIRHLLMGLATEEVSAADLAEAPDPDGRRLALL